MDPKECVAALVGRCAVLMSYHHLRHGPGPKPEMRHELGWLAADAARWGVPAERVGVGVLAELRRHHDAGVAQALIEEFWAAFGPEGPGRAAA